MFVFDGYLTGKAEKYYWKKSRRFGRNLLLFAMVLFLPLVILWSFETQKWLVLGGYCLAFAIIPLISMIPQSKKEKKSLTPKKIFSDGDYIVCVSDKFTESRLISDAKQVNKYDDFYEIIFPFGKVSDKFICQKSLLSKGTLKEFEFLFEGKICEKKGEKKTGDSSLS